MQESAIARVGMGCGVAVILVVMAFAIMVGAVELFAWLHPGTSTAGLGQGAGFLLIPILGAALVVGLVTSWKPRVGLVLAALLVLGVLGLGGLLAAGG